MSNIKGIEVSGETYNLEDTEARNDVGTVETSVSELISQKVYSENEIDTGKKWIDGKPIYRKVCKCTSATALSVGGWSNVPGWDVDTSDISVITYLFGSVDFWGRLDWIRRNDKLVFCCLVSSITISAGSYLTIEYTKNS